MKKRANKTNPIGIRLNIKNLEKAYAKSGLSTPQKVVDLALDCYVNDNNSREIVTDLPVKFKLTLDDCPFPPGIERTLWIKNNLINQ